MHEKVINHSESKELDKPRDHCAVVGIRSSDFQDVASLVRFALHAQQNRGEDGSGIAAYDGYSGTFRVFKGLGLVLEGAFPDGKLEEHEISGSVAIGHNRYATSGRKDEDPDRKRRCLQPYVVSHDRNSLALAHNGNIPERYLESLRSELPPGIPFQSDTDSEIVAWRILFADGDSWREKVINGLNGVVGAYSFVIATDDGDLFGVKDPLGIRPLVLARTQSVAVLVSESRGLEYIAGVEEKKEVGAGQLVHIRRNGEISVDQIFPQTNTARCLVEPIYLKHPYSLEGERQVRSIRERMGEELASEIQFPPDYVIIGVPDSGIEIAEGYARALGRTTDNLIKKDRYRPGRSFISDSSHRRDKTLELKFTISDDVVGKRLVIVDDSVIRGKTTEKLVKSLLERGALEVYVVSASPKFINVCDLGVDIATLMELKALRKNGGQDYDVKPDEEMATEIGANSIHFLSLEGLIRAIGGKRNEFCINCLAREHPIDGMGEQKDLIYTARQLTPT
ncbi:MAG: hypothetical protein A2629_00405 [Candidatus Levybacteria bacterium RIFCSPHIGHO2_01_FULL_41_15]|nr:MAG: hypothetical protein A2629_00405 [Candidatus Levybacteria bacterium RIFCSPHIGHO2_01_FULL_41_15]